MTAKIDDFADWLSPILVKELRQGLRTRVFVGAFLLLQAFMCFCIFLSLGSARGGGDGDTAFFWTPMVILSLALPLRGLAAVFGEIRGATLELLLLSQLSAWRILWGKWLALAVQIALFFCAVLPYVVLRYFLGGIDLAGELLALGILMAASCTLTAIAVGLSPFLRSIIGRVFVMGAGAVIYFFCLIGIVSELIRLITNRVSFGAWPEQGVLLLLAPFVVGLMLEVGAQQIAPAAENHATRKRLLLLLVLFFSAGILALEGLVIGLSFGSFVLVALCIVTPFYLEALLEPTSSHPGLYRPFVRRGFLGKLAGRFLYPGRATGLLFFLTYAGVFAGITFWIFFTERGGIDRNFLERIAHPLGLLEAILVPVLLTHLLARKKQNRYLFFALIQLLLFCLAVFINVRTDSNAPQFCAVIPTVGPLLSQWYAYDQSSFFGESWFQMLVINGCAFALLFGLEINDWRLIREMERRAAASRLPDEEENPKSMASETAPPPAAS